jgi:hypothetical protein
MPALRTATGALTTVVRGSRGREDDEEEGEKEVIRRKRMKRGSRG